jgi:hypothetical protein
LQYDVIFIATKKCARCVSNVSTFRKRPRLNDW